ncbi:MAG: hypothetical protein ACLR4S_10110, partial [Blautia massiliensis (ex Durand et al. 2017)]
HNLQTNDISRLFRKRKSRFERAWWNLPFPSGLSVRAGVLMERLKAYDPELPKDMEPMVYVNYCEKSELGNPRCAKNSRKI